LSKQKWQRAADARLAAEKPGERGLRDASQEALTSTCAAQIEAWRKVIEKAPTRARLQAIAEIVKEQNVNVRLALRDDWRKRWEELDG
jgi:hypothetical protein